MSWGLVLSGGAAFGIANGGVIEVLEREKLKPDCVAGSSMGAIIAATYAMGIPVSELHACVRKLTLGNVACLSKHPLKGGLCGGILRQNLEHHLEPLLGDARIADCKIPFVCTAGRVKKPIQWLHILKKGFTEEILSGVEFHVFSPETRLLDAVMASSAIPVVFSPVEIDGKQYVDLCHFGPIPARALQSKCHPEKIIATDTYPTYEALRNFLPGGWNEFLEAGYAEIRKSKAVCDLLIKPVMPFALFRFDKGEEFWQAGKKAAAKCIADVRAIIQRQ
ncbi:MAG: patatin-like phospholipase family protein [Candidatus Peribacteraceae bacterium]|nr:patatin-like phospholipase family protein [Candidatus Peribacteraceae bacterium]MDD5074426.1 patatin-like phospholipase family protein [Candidatus Peribacteraceae bacterium]